MQFVTTLGLTPSQLQVTPLWSGTLTDPTAPASSNGPPGTAGQLHAIALLVAIPGGATFQLVREAVASNQTNTPSTSQANPYGWIGVWARSVPSSTANKQPLPWTNGWASTATHNPPVYVAAPGATTVRLTTTSSGGTIAEATVDGTGLATFTGISVAPQPGAVLARSYDASGRLVGSTPLVGAHDNDPLDDAQLHGGSETIAPSS